jgi:hypothetical protein
MVGASTIKKELLLKNPFDEVLDQYGIGDNYGICISFPGKVVVLTNTFVLHYKDSENRLDATIAYYRRVLALHYFMKKSKRFNFINTLWLLWSLIGIMIMFVKNSQFILARAALKSIIQYLHNNPLYRFKKHIKNVCQISASIKFEGLFNRIYHSIFNKINFIASIKYFIFVRYENYSFVRFALNRLDYFFLGLFIKLELIKTKISLSKKNSGNSNSLFLTA